MVFIINTIFSLYKYYYKYLLLLYEKYYNYNLRKTNKFECIRAATRHTKSPVNFYLVFLQFFIIVFIFK